MSQRQFLFLMDYFRVLLKPKSPLNSILTIRKKLDLFLIVRFLVHFWSLSTKMECGNFLYNPFQLATLIHFSHVKLFSAVQCTNEVLQHNISQDIVKPIRQYIQHLFQGTHRKAQTCCVVSGVRRKRVMEHLQNSAMNQSCKNYILEIHLFN